MDVQMLTNFFMWCSIINMSLLLLSFLMLAYMGDLAYRIHSKWFPMPREKYNAILFSVIIFYKTLVFVVCVVPWIALKILA